MNINTNLLESIRKAREEKQIPTPKDKPELSLVDWFNHLRTEPRVADKKYVEEFHKTLKHRGIIK